MEAEKEIVITLDSKKIVAAGIMIVFLIIVSYTYFSALFAFVAPSQDFPLEVTQVETFDTSNNSKTSFTLGETVRINATVEMALQYVNYPWSGDYIDFVSDVTANIIVTVMDPNKVPVWIDNKTRTISVGEVIDHYFDYPIPGTGASTGSYRVEVMVWNDWLPSGDPLSTFIGEVSFNVA